MSLELSLRILFAASVRRSSLSRLARRHHPDKCEYIYPARHAGAARVLRTFELKKHIPQAVLPELQRYPQPPQDLDAGWWPHPADSVSGHLA